MNLFALKTLLSSIADGNINADSLSQALEGLNSLSSGPVADKMATEAGNAIKAAIRGYSEGELREVIKDLYQHDAELFREVAGEMARNNPAFRALMKKKAAEMGLILE